jgi:predicted RNase H-like HicB family nuclease
VSDRRMRLTGLVKQEDDLYSALCLELDIASCGETEEEAISGLQDAIETYVQYMLDEGRENEIYRPVPIDALREYLTSEEERPITQARPFHAIPLEYQRAA